MTWKFVFLTTLFFLFSTFNLKAQGLKYSLADFYKYDADLAQLTDSIFNTLTERERIAQMVITSAGDLGKSDETVKDLVEKNLIGGVVYLKGKEEDHKSLIKDLKKISTHNGSIPLINSMDAEPSLFNGRILGTEKMVNTIDIKSLEQCDSVVKVINQKLRDVGIHHNYAPVVDLSPNNEAIKSRSFGSNRDSVVMLSNQFISSTQSDNIVATAKHFPGHGLVTGDTHKKSVYIDGPLQEVDVYRHLIEDGVISIMVSHITVINNEQFGTKGLPSSCSRTIVTDLLKNEMNFKGIVITDALNIMKAVTVLGKATLKASIAGCDMILMPIDELQTINWIEEEMKVNPVYKRQVYQSVLKILRLKICLNLI
ncbi:beta-glucosidase [Marivirga sericea]|uniref:beta-N-acetylhexosaminidase n=1 Tax=Marivirga sericea TaxID=1028 RepID=A0A1X7K6A1_9BACT|nr:glycoside hydrolase family 3 N-terminal domain-containing protein [Marivirga sericea]SMG36275.1 beta-glucosidase [Marivirga sericea]